jgi:hypothetical protein
MGFLFLISHKILKGFLLTLDFISGVAMYIQPDQLNSKLPTLSTKNK